MVIKNVEVEGSVRPNMNQYHYVMEYSNEKVRSSFSKNQNMNQNVNQNNQNIIQNMNPNIIQNVKQNMSQNMPTRR